MPAAAKPTLPGALPGELKLRALEGDDVVNSIPLGKSVAPVIEVRDANDLPVEGASVVFSAPENGPGGTFPGGSHTFTVSSNAQGQATCPFVPNAEPGKFKFVVKATAGNRSGQIILTQTNTNAGYVGRVIPRQPIYKKWYFWAVIGAVGVAGLTYWAVNRSSNTTVVITPGGATVGAPQ
jgi:hypothetical protein